MDEQEKQDAFVETVGVSKADRLDYLWRDSYKNGTEYDRVFNTGRYQTKEQVFVIKAKREGFTVKEISLFLSL